MLHEILLSLSGNPSPLLKGSYEENGRIYQQPLPLLTKPELALLEPLTKLSYLHRDLRSYTAQITSTHHSTICRAVSTAISSIHLERFQQKVLDVEKAILEREASLVGGYGIVPLSAVVGEFEGWIRPMEWLWMLAQLMVPDPKKGKQQKGKAYTGADIINKLRKEVKTGYSDIEETASTLIKAAEMSWMRQLSAWILYGRLPSIGADDFFIHKLQDEAGDGNTFDEFRMDETKLPSFVSLQTASSILFIGKSLNHVRTRSASKVSSPEMALLPEHLSILSSLTSPISVPNMSAAIQSIRLSLSQNALQQLLPFGKILEILSLLHGFLLLGRGEFAMSLVGQADERVRLRHKSPGASRLDKTPAAGLQDVQVKEGEVSAALNRTFAELVSLQSDENYDEELELARDLLRLSLTNSTSTKPRHRDSSREAHGIDKAAHEASFDNLLFPAPTSLTLRIRPPLDLFLTPSDLDTYSTINAYLLSPRRSHSHLSGLWKQTSLRRTHPSPLGPPLSNTQGGAQRLLAQRERTNDRVRSTRKYWATANAALFLLSELSSYFQGEVVHGHWTHLRAWLAEIRPSSSSSAGSRPGTAGSLRTDPDFWRVSNNTRPSEPSSLLPQSRHNNRHNHSTTPLDPETLTRAHKAYLTSLHTSLLLTDAVFTSRLRTLLTHIDHLVALIQRLQGIQQNLDLETDEGIEDALADYKKEESIVLRELEKARSGV